MRREFLVILVSIFLLSFFSACSNPTDSVDPPEAPPVSNTDFTVLDDSDESVTYEWHSGSPTGISLGDNESSVLISLGFDFEYYGETFNSIYIHSNGFLYFSGPSGTYLPAQIPGTAEPDGIIAGLWTDLDPSAGGTISYEKTGSEGTREFWVTYEDVKLKGSAETITFQIALYESTNKIRFQYENFEILVKSTIGLEDPTGTSAFFLEDQNYAMINSVYDNMVLEFTPQ